MPGDGARGYLAVAGGSRSHAVLGSTSTDLRSGFGGLEGRALRAGDRLEADAMSGRPARWTGVPTTGPIRIVRGPHPETPRRTHWRVDGRRRGGSRRGQAGWTAARAGVRCRRWALPLGAIQVPPDGRPIVMLADRPVTGGYVVPACVIRADIGRVAQLRTGDTLTFASVSHEEAIEALRRAEVELAKIEPLDPTENDELGWAGSHG